MDFTQKAMQSAKSAIDQNAMEVLSSFDEAETLELVDRTDYTDGDDNLIDMLETMRPSNISKH